MIGFRRDARAREGGKLHRGEIRDWIRRSAPHGLRFRIEGTLGGAKITTTSIVAQDGSEVETLVWRYTLIGEEK